MRTIDNSLTIRLAAIALLGCIIAAVSADDFAANYREAVISAGNAAKNHVAAEYAAAADTIAYALARKPVKSENSAEVEDLEVLLFWCRALETAAAVSEKTPETLPDADSETNNPIIEPEPEPEIDTARLEALQAHDMLLDMLTSAVEEYSAGNEEKAMHALTSFLETPHPDPFEIDFFIAAYCSRLDSILKALDAGIARRIGTNVTYSAGSNDRDFSGKINSVENGIVHIVSGPTRVGVSIFALKRVFLLNALQPLPASDRWLLCMYLNLKREKHLADSLCPAGTDEQEFKRAYNTLSGMLQSMHDERIVAEYMQVLELAQRKADSGELTPALTNMLKLNALTDHELLVLNKTYFNEVFRTIPEFLAIIMTNCASCKGEFKLACVHCKGTGKIVEDTYDTFFMRDRGTLRFSKCRHCGGDGWQFCGTCYKRRFSVEGLEFARRLQQLFPSEDKQEGVEQ